MLQLVTTADCAAHLRLDTTADDPWLAIWIPAISQAIQQWLKEDWRLYVVLREADGSIALDSAGEPILEVDTSGNPIVNPAVRAACLVELGQQFRFRDGSGAQAVPSHWGHGFNLGAAATSLLTPLRKSTVA